MKVLLVYRTEQSSDFFISVVPVGLGSMAAVLRSDGVAARVANLSGMSWSQVQEILTAEQPELVGLSVFTHNRRESKRLAQLIRKVCRDCWVVCGGPHASHSVHEVLAWPGVDAVVVGEGEGVVRELASARQRMGASFPVELPGLVTSIGMCAGPSNFSSRQPLANLDDLPYAYTGLTNGIGVDLRKQAEFVISSRGCPATCTFCSSPGFWGGKLRFRSACSVVGELKAIQEELGLLYFSLRDDTFTANRQRVIDICQRIRSENLFILWNCQSRVTAVDAEVLSWLKLAGCECIQFGIESGSERILQLLGKRVTRQQVQDAFAAARKVGLQVSVYLIAGVPGESATDIAVTEALLNEILPHDGQVSPLVYYPGTAMFDRAVADGCVSADLFVESAAPALPVRVDAEVDQVVRQLHSCLRRLQQRAAYKTKDFAAQKALLGYCHATNLQAGEYYVGQGNFSAARQEYAEIIRLEPKNPWGWLAMGELELVLENYHGADAALQEVWRLVPRHLPVVETLVEVNRVMGRQRQMRLWQERRCRMRDLV